MLRHHWSAVAKTAGPKPGTQPLREPEVQESEPPQVALPGFTRVK